MKITRIEQFFPRPRVRLVKISTDAGIDGWGETTLEGKPKSVIAAIEELSEYLIGKDPLRILHGLLDGDDTVAGSRKNDSIWGFGGDDRLFGRAGNDWLYGHRGDDIMTGGKGSDTFVFLAGYDHDTVTDFDRTGSDHDFIRMDYYLFDDITYSEANGSVTMTLPTGDPPLEGSERAEFFIEPAWGDDLTTR